MALNRLACLRKVRYRSLKQAQMIADKMAHDHQNWSFKAYRCQFDNSHFHVGRVGQSDWFKSQYPRGKKWQMDNESKSGKAEKGSRQLELLYPGSM